MKRVTIRSGRQRGSGQRGHLVILHTGLGKPDQAGSDDWLPEAKVDGAYGSWLAGECLTEWPEALLNRCSTNFCLEIRLKWSPQWV